MTEFYAIDGSLWKWEFSANTLEVYSPSNEKYIVKKNQVLPHKWWYYPKGQLYYQHGMPVYIWHQATLKIDKIIYIDYVVRDFILKEIYPHWQLERSD